MRGQKSKFNKTNKIILVFLLLIGCLGSNFSTAYADDEQQADNVFNYVSLGASNTNGFGLHGYFEEDWYENPALGIYSSGIDVSGYHKVTEGSYPQLIKNYIDSLGYETNIEQLAQSSMRPEELRYLLDDDYAGDPYTEWRFYDPERKKTWWYYNLDDLKQVYRQAITNADLITYDLGASNFSIYLMNQLTDDYYTNDPKYLDKEYQTLYTNYATTLKSTLFVIKDYIDDDIINTIAYAYAGFCNNFDKSMEKIYELNPDANVMVIGIQNLFDGLVLKLSDIQIPIYLDEIYGVLIDDANKYINNSRPTILNRNKSKYYTKYKYVDLNKDRVEFFIDDVIAYNGDPSTISQPLKEAIDCLDTSTDIMLKFRVAAGICQANNWHPEYLQKFENHMKDFVDICEELCPEVYETTLTRAYDAIYTAFAKACKTSPLIADVLLAEDQEQIEEELEDGIFGLIETVVTRSLQEAADPQNVYLTDDELNQLVNSILDSDAKTFILAYAVRGTIGNSFYSHPNKNGHAAIFNSIKNVATNSGILKKYAPTSQGIVIECSQLVYPKKSTALSDDFKVVEKFSDGTSVDLTADCEITVPDMSTNGVKTVEVKYKDTTLTQDIYVFGTKGISLNLEGRIIINYYTEYPNYEDAGYTPGVLFFKQNEEPTQNEISSAYGSGLGVTDFYIEDGYLIFQYDKLAAKELSENVYIVTYAVEDGNPVFGAPQKFRVMDYKNMVFSGSSDSKLLTLIVDMLNYGSAAQTYFAHNTSTLANSELTKAQKAYATSTTPTVRKRTTAYSDYLSSSNVKIKSASISLDNEIVVNYYATIDAGEREIESANLLVFDNFEEEQTYDKTTADKTYEMFIPQGKEEYCGNIPNIVAKDMRKLFYARVHVTYTDGTEEYSSIRSFSVEDYAYQALNTPSASQGLKDLMKAMIKYGDSASSYLNSKGA